MKGYLNLEVVGAGFDAHVIKCELWVGNNIYFFESGWQNLLRIIKSAFGLKKKKLYIYTQDLYFTTPLIIAAIKNENEFRYKTVIFNLQIYYFEVTYNKQNIRFYSMEKLWPNFNGDLYLATPTEFTAELIPNQVPNQDAITALKLAEKTINKLYKKYKLNQIKNHIYSISSFAYKCFFKNFNNFNVENKLLECVDGFIRCGYFGGRCEVFGNPNIGENIEYFDFTAMYSQCMMESFPTGGGFFDINPTEVKKPGFYDITFKSHNMKIPILPHKECAADKLMFANGKMRGVYWYEEILFFIKGGGEVLKIHSSYVFNEVGCVFKNFIENFINLRWSSKIYNGFAKLCINSFYGRLGVSQNNLESAIITDQMDFENLLRNNLIINFTQVAV